MQPYTFDQAVNVATKAAAGQIAAETAMKEAARDSAVKDERYRVAVAKEIVRLHDADGVAWTVCQDLARGNPQVARLRRERDIAEGVREAMQQAAWRRAADRKDTQRFIDWSMRRELAEGYGTAPEPEFSEPIGSRSA
jgi:hypothetical protein